MDTAMVLVTIVSIPILVVVIIILYLRTRTKVAVNNSLNEERVETVKLVETGGNFKTRMKDFDKSLKELEKSISDRDAILSSTIKGAGVVREPETINSDKIMETVNLNEQDAVSETNTVNEQDTITEPDSTKETDAMEKTAKDSDEIKGKENARPDRRSSEEA